MVPKILRISRVLSFMIDVVEIDLIPCRKTLDFCLQLPNLSLKCMKVAMSEVRTWIENQHLKK